MGESVLENSAGSLCGYSDWWEVLSTVAIASLSDCSASDAWSVEVIFDMPFSSIVTIPLVEGRMRLGPTLCGSILEYESVANLSVSAATNGGSSTYTHRPGLKLVVAQSRLS